MQRVLEPEVMDTWEEAVDYDAMDFVEVNTAFAQQAIAIGTPFSSKVLDAGTGTARIPILLCQMQSRWQVVGIDLAENMLHIGWQNVEQAGLQNQIVLKLLDVKQLPYQDEYFDLIISNSLIHHLPDPLPFLLELKRVLKPNGGILIRDLIRPPNKETLNDLVKSIGSKYSDHQKKLFHDSLQAAFTIEEIKQLIAQANLQGVTVYQSSERHWTAERAWKQSQE